MGLRNMKAVEHVMLAAADKLVERQGRVIASAVARGVDTEHLAESVKHCAEALDLQLDRLAEAVKLLDLENLDG
jgi:hypothetical protein